MSTTIPVILRQLGNKHPHGFSLDELKEALLWDGYGPEKIAHRVKQVVASHEIIRLGENDTYVTVYNPYHVKICPELDEVQIRPVKIERDGSVTLL